jgi:hypothetical protein
VKRGGPLKRKKPMRSQAQLVRTAKPKQGRPKPDGPAESTLANRARKAVHDRFDGRCEMRSPWCRVWAMNFSHRLAEGQGGLWTTSNGLAACGMGNLYGCHGYLHQHPLEAKKNGWIVQPWEDPLKKRVLIHSKFGHTWVLLDDEGGMTLAPWPKQSDGHPDDLPVNGSLDVDGAA